MKSAIFMTVTALASTSYAATVTLETTKCINGDVPLEQFDIEIGTSKPVTKDLPSVCGLRILSASDSVDVNTIQCQAFRDVEGTQPGSAIFTFAEPALIGTNPIQEKSFLCTIPSSPNAVILERRQNINTTASGTVSPGPRSTLFMTSTASAPEDSTTSVAPSTIVSTIIASASSGLPTSSGNATAPSNTGRPSATESGADPAETTGAAGTIGVGVGVVVAAFAALLL